MFAERNIILTGFMGTGKTTVGRRLAKRLGYAFVDTDALIEARCAMAVHEIFRERGEAFFRGMEATLARELATAVQQVIATGGRLMLDDRNAAVLSPTGPVFCLWATPEEVLARVARDTVALRPLLSGPAPEDRIRALFEERRRGYARFTPIVTSGKTIAAVVQELYAILCPSES
ncbi:MAG: shikimate kinase [Desulfobacterales bacterium]|jgi:shikimate kinase